MRRRAVLGILGTVGTGGCLRLAGETTTTRQSATTAASARSAAPATATEPSTTTEEWSDEPSYPYGLADDGVSPLLYDTCVQSLSGRAFRARYTKVDAERATRKWDRTFAVADRQAVAQWTRNQGGLVDMFRTGNEGLWREDLGDAYTYGRDAGGFSMREIVWDKELEPLISAPAWGSPERTNDARPAIWTVEADGLETPNVAPGYVEGELRAVDSASLRVDETGVIRSFEASYTVYDANADDTRSYTFRYLTRDLGSVAVSEPEWTATARQQRPTASASLTDDRRFVRLRVESGGLIATDSRISVFEEGTDRKFVTHTQSSLEEGDVAYLYRTSDEDRVEQGTVVVGERPSDVTPLALDGEYSLSAFRKDTNYFPRIQVSAPE
ncbi:hypothetical protein G9C85_16765 [Halorubellus sp. JP-L1]|uniref:hypothetical protein n=1 Tax=Halorubellus sp. JP-L1 TaxID=2715753 RepID=UPI0014081626|nr:hypothetical protein [Halorubellus sp. JP-L1]NHN43271.1 hypothetical protein [Halorubellus sp. JP-L1]